MNVGMRLTQAGENLIAKGLLGKEIKFTRGAIGDGEFDYESEKVFDLTEMRGEKLTLPIESIKRTGDGTVTISVHSTNAEVYEGFCAKEHAIFAQDPDSGEEILYAYRNVGTEYTFIPSNIGPVKKDIKYAYVTVIKDADNITAVLDLTFAYPSLAEYEEHIKSDHPHPNTPNHYLDIEEASEIWAADNDSHLHKIKLEDLKRQMVCEGERVDEAAELGLDANVLLYDNDGELTDRFKKRVTSSAENGLLLGLEDNEGIREGAEYTISDGWMQERVKVKSVRYNESGYHCKLCGRLMNQYDWDSTYLYRTTLGGADRRWLKWQAGGFGGVEANFPRVIKWDTQAAQIIGTGFIDNDYFILG